MRNNALKTIRIVYIVYTFYTLFVISVSDYKIEYALSGLISIWLIYLAYSLGYKSIRFITNVKENKNDNFIFSNIFNWKTWQYVLASLVSWLCSISAGKFYTSRGFSSVIRGLFKTNNAYNIYQKYLIEANIGVFKISKLPYIFMLVICTVLLIWSMIGLLLNNSKLSIIQKIYLANIVLSYFYFGIARGTNFEMYIIFVLIVFCTLSKKTTTKLDMIKQRWAIVLIGILSFLVVLVFRYVVAARGNVFRNQICTEIQFVPQKLIATIFPILTNIGLSVFRYFGFGIFTIGMTQQSNIFMTTKGILAYIMPQGFNLLFGTDLMTIARQTVDIGVGWVPDYFLFINLLGFPITIILFFLVGRLISKLNSSHRSKLLKNLLSSIVFLEMLSIPIGNFIATSTPNKITILLILVWYFKGKFVFSRRRKSTFI